jgi:two-component system chemotaxis sensor kinase CheA
MVTSLSRDEFLQNLRDSGLFTSDEIDTIVGDLPATQEANAEATARRLVAAGKLTAFEAAAVRERRFEDLVIGNYQVLDKLGAGGMGTVFKARHRRMKRVVAIKVLSREIAKSETLVQRFQREVEAVARLSHPNIVMAHDADEAEAGHFLVMEFVNGRDLASEVAKRGPLPIRQAVDCIRQAASALEYAHSQGIIHRDIKPANLLLDVSGTVKVADLGLARFNDQFAPAAEEKNALTQAGSIMGTVDFMPPEQALGLTTIDHRADIYSLGCTLHFLLLGRPPYVGSSMMATLLKHREGAIPALAAARADVPLPLDALFTLMLAKAPADRIQTMTEVIAVLESIQADLSELAGATLAGTSPATDTPAADTATGVWENQTLSAATPTPTPPPVDPTLAGATRALPLKVLLVEPSRTQSSIIRKYLETQGVPHVVAAASGQEALQLARTERPDAVVSAQHLSDMTGLELAQQIREEGEEPWPGFVLISSEGEISQMGTLSRSDMAVVLQKPFTPEKLADALRLAGAVKPLAPSMVARAKIRALIVDDSAASRKHIQAVLTGLGLSQFVQAADGAQAVAAMAGATFDLIVTDYNMPHMDGRGLVGYLKQNPATASIPIIMVTTEQDPGKLDAVRQKLSSGRGSQDRRSAGEIAMNEVIREFIIETHENLAQLDLDLVTLEKDPAERETLARVFRTLHTVKGTAGFLGLQKLQAVAHAAENLLSLLREGKLAFNADIASALLKVVDAVRQMLDAVGTTETDGDGDYTDLIQTLERLRAAEDGQGPDMPSSPAKHAAPKPKSGESVPPPPVQPAPSNVAEFAAPEATEARATAVSDSSIRVDVGLLDKLMTLVGELVLARNQVMQFSNSQENTGFLGTVQKLNQLTTELQAGVMKTRMQPISNIWSKFPRVVRDLALACGKQARLEMAGQDTELDKTIVEAIRDPLTHLVRNAIDHGIEPPADRLARDKSAEGRLALHAFHEGGKVIIEIADDGGGIDPQRVRAKAIRAQLLTPEQADRLNDSELVNLVFLAGFSTADKVTQFSGRGVGMDVVRTNVERIGGTVTLESRLGRGTTVKMKIPLTLAIIPALTITCVGDRYAIPQVSLLELVRLEGEQAVRGIERIHGAPVYRLRGNLLPLVYLDRQLHGEKSPSCKGNAGSSGEVMIVVLQADDRQFGLVVDAIHDTEEIVVKPLQKQVKSIGIFAGATIMGDGKVALILDVLGLAQRANVISGVRERALSDKTIIASAPTEDRQTVLLFSTPGGGRMAVPLSLVDRLEEFPRAALESVGPQDVVQYRDEILPLIYVSRALRRRRAQDRNGRLGSRLRASHSRMAKERDTVQVVVCTNKGQRVGLVVDHILDIAEETITSRSATHRPGVLFNAVIQGRVTEFLDVEGVMRLTDPDLIEPPQTIAVKV